MEPGSIVEALDVGEEIALGLGVGLIFAVMDELGLQGMEEAFHRRVVEAVGLAARRCARQLQGLSDIGVRRIAHRDRSGGPIRRPAAAGGLPWSALTRQVRPARFPKRVQLGRRPQITGRVYRE